MTGKLSFKQGLIVLGVLAGLFYVAHTDTQSKDAECAKAGLRYSEQNFGCIEGERAAK